MSFANAYNNHYTAKVWKISEFSKYLTYFSKMASTLTGRCHLNRMNGNF